MEYLCGAISVSKQDSDGKINFKEAKSLFRFQDSVSAQEIERLENLENPIDIIVTIPTVFQMNSKVLFYYYIL